VTDPSHLHSGGVASYSNGGIGGSGNPSGTTSNTGSATTGISVAISTTGSSGTNANYQPYITVYMWKRTA
jgi:hypothetical protein